MRKFDAPPLLPPGRLRVYPRLVHRNPKTLPKVRRPLHEKDDGFRRLLLRIEHRLPPIFRVPQLQQLTTFPANEGFTHFRATSPAVLKMSATSVSLPICFLRS